MCGIVGILGISDDPQAKSRLSSAMDSIAYRGPDARSSWHSDDGKLHLGHLRLSILDTSHSGTQPMHLSYGSNDFSIVFNGEVYNFIEIKQKLEVLGHTFVTHTDTEVILHAYAQWGESCVHEFNGMFAIAIWDTSQKKLIIYRDRMGEKPLYYHHAKNGSISFASEIKALNILTNAKKPTFQQLDPVLIDHFFSAGFIPGDTPLQCINSTTSQTHRLLPGHKLVWHESSPQNILNTPYWTESIESLPEGEFSEHQLLENTKSLFNHALELRLRSDVPVGVFLSGGLDSSAIVAKLSKMTSSPLKTFSVRYDAEMFGAGYDESVHARLVAKQFGAEYHEFTMTPQLFVDYLMRYIEVMDEPVTEAAAISMHYLSDMAKEHVTVVLAGEGSDEIFAGYELYRNMEIIEKVRSIVPTSLISLLTKIFSTAIPKRHKIQKYFRWLNLPFEDRYRGISTSDPEDRSRIFKHEFTKLIERKSEQHPLNAWISQQLKSTQGMPIIERMMQFDRKTWLPDDLLIKADRMSMHSSIELRVPFLDPNLIRYVGSLPRSMKIKGRNPKWALKALCVELPESILQREKTGFPTPLQIMLKSGPLLDLFVQQLRDDNPIFTILSFRKLLDVLEEHRSGKADHHRLIWQVLVFSLWVNVHCESEGV